MKKEIIEITAFLAVIKSRTEALRCEASLLQNECVALFGLPETVLADKAAPLVTRAQDLGNALLAFAAFINSEAPTTINLVDEAPNATRG